MFWIPGVDSQQQFVLPQSQWTKHNHVWLAVLRQPGDAVLEHLLQQDHVEPTVELTSDLDLDPDLTESAGNMKRPTGLT